MNGKTEGKGRFMGEMIKGVSDKLVEWIWKLCNIAFESSIVLKTGGLL